MNQFQPLLVPALLVDVVSIANMKGLLWTRKTQSSSDFGLHRLVSWLQAFNGGPSFFVFYFLWFLLGYFVGRMILDSMGGFLGFKLLTDQELMRAKQSWCGYGK
ncbi:hypothetical protein COP1_018998 [Malus domestica]